MSAQTNSRGKYVLYGFFFKIRGLLAVILLFAMFFTTRWECGQSAAVWIIGFAMFATGFGLRIRSQQFLRYRLRDDGGLAMTGPYSYVRNPVYIGNIIGLAGLCVLCRLVWLAPLAAAWMALVYHLAVHFEEMRLAKRYGEPFRLYCEQVPRWIPRRSPTRAPSAGMTSVARAARVEWQNLVLLLVPLGKAWFYRPHAGQMGVSASGVTTAIAEHRWTAAAIVAVGIAALAAWNLKLLRPQSPNRAQ